VSSIAPGTILGRYRVERLVGAGGMGEVYAATDTQLGRSVALKVLPEDVAGDTGRVRRFVREARLASGLNHHAIVTVHDSGEEILDGRSVHYLVMELVEGETFGAWRRKQRDPQKVVAVLAGVAEGLAAAHANGIVHRDLKPSNIIVAADGHPKILDFGAAKLTERITDERSAETDTAPSAAMGTPAYMSPEQIEGKELDARSDIFSLGCVIAEAFSGSSPFRRANHVESMHAVLHDEPSLESLPHDLQRIARKCLRKDREERYQSARDVAIDLRDVLGEPPAQTRRRPRWMVPAASLLLLFVIAAAIWNSRRPQTPRAAAEPVMLRMTNSGNVIDGAISPDGKSIAYATYDGDLQTLRVRDANGGSDAVVIPPEAVHYNQVRIAPDGASIFYSLAPAGNSIVDIMQVPILGGARRKVVSDIDLSFALSADGTRISFIRFSAIDRVFRLFIADIAGGTETQIAERKYPYNILNSAWHPNGRAISFVSWVPSGGGKRESAIFSIDLTSRRVTPFGPRRWKEMFGLAWLPDASGVIINGYDGVQAPQVWLIQTDGATRRITSDLSVYGYTVARWTSLSVTADSRNVLVLRSDVASNLWIANADGSAPRAVTRGVASLFGINGVRWLPDGRIVHTVFTPTDNSLNAVSTDGTRTEQLTRGHFEAFPDVSPDGQRLAFVSDRSGSDELWTSDLNGLDLRQVTRLDGRLAHPTWSADGKSIGFVTYGKVQAIWRVAAGGGQPVRITDGPADHPRFSPDGKWLLCYYRSRIRNRSGRSPSFLLTEKGKCGASTSRTATNGRRCGARTDGGSSMQRARTARRTFSSSTPRAARRASSRISIRGRFRPSTCRGGTAGW
jgi:serine/threonine protein kinase/Tol biopolymer transport system component